MGGQRHKRGRGGNRGGEKRHKSRDGQAATEGGWVGTPWFVPNPVFEAFYRVRDDRWCYVCMYVCMS